MRKTPLRRKTPLNRVSYKRRCENQEYGRLRNAYLLNHPKCEACVILGNIEPMPATEIHHREGRGIKLNDASTFIAACRWCHQTIHRHPKTARQLGLLK